MKKNIVSIAIGSAFVASAALAPSVHAADAGNPFTGTKLSAGYQVADASMPAADKKRDGKCSEAKCSAAKKKTEEKKPEAKCSADKKGADKMPEAKCSADKNSADKK